jgi:hypothetical protein
LPAFSLGDLAYFYQPVCCTASMTTAEQLIDRGLVATRSWREKAKLLEAVIRFTAPAGLSAAAQRFAGRWQHLGLSAAQLAALLRTVFNDVALSPYTDFVDKTLAFVEQLVEAAHLTSADQIDFLSFLLRQLARHLTAYDLVVFHHRGANYPDALLLDAVLRAYLALAERHTECFTASAQDTEADAKCKRIRRRALRMGVLLRWQYEGHPVPDAPTSPGENSRVLPAPFGRVPEEQILDPKRRDRQLFASEPLPLTEFGQALLRQSIADLVHDAELRELGTARRASPGLPSQTHRRHRSVQPHTEASRSKLCRWSGHPAQPPATAARGGHA